MTKLPAPNITRSPVSSSNVASVGYDDETGELEVEFSNGATYRLSGVPADVASSLRGSPSPGSYYANNIKGAYNARRV